MSVILGLLIVPWWVWLLVAYVIFGAIFAAWLEGRTPRYADTTTPLGFEQHCVNILIGAGWIARTTVASGDQGVDITAEKAGRRVVLQCKLYSQPVGNKAVQEVIAGRMFAGADAAAVVTNATYTRSARDLARRTGVLLLTAHDLRKADKLFGIPTRANVACPRCPASLALPLGRAGYVNCPQCAHRFHTTT